MASDKEIVSIYIWHDVFNGGYGMHVEDKLKENRRNRLFSEELDSRYLKYTKKCEQTNSRKKLKDWYIEEYVNPPCN